MPFIIIIVWITLGFFAWKSIVGKETYPKIINIVMLFLSILFGPISFLASLLER